MAFTRKFLTALGIEDEKVDEIINAHAEVVNGLKEERDKWKGVADDLKDVKVTLDEAQKQLDEFKQAGNPYEKKYEDLKSEFDDFKADVAKKEVLAKKTVAFKALLNDAGISSKRIDTVVKASPDAIDGLELEENGDAKDAKEIVSKLKDEWADFVVKADTKGADPATPPANTGGSGMTHDQIMAIKDRAERRAAIAENPAEFGIEI